MNIKLQGTYTALILSKLIAGNKLVLTSILMPASGDGQCVCVFLQPILNIFGLNSKVVELIFIQLHIIMEPKWNTNTWTTSKVFRRRIQQAQPVDLNV